MSASEGWVEVARLRQGLYRFYSAALLEPTPDRAGALIASAAYLDQLGIESFTYAMTWKRVMADMPSEQSFDSLRGEYVRLFVAGVDGGLSPPTESFYAGDADRGHVGTAFAIVESDYKALGVAPVASGSVSSDHVATEMEVLAFLCAREAVCWQEDDKAAALVELRHQNDFLQAHLSWWLPQFRLRVIGAGAAPFYGAVVEGAVAVVRHDCDYVRALLDQVPQ